ncbi:MAG: twin-arginine translocase subunit TatC [Acidobacteriota bacterium]
MKDTTNQGRNEETATESTTDQTSRHLPDPAPADREVNPAPPAEHPPPDAVGTLEPATGGDPYSAEQAFRYDDEGVPAEGWPATAPAAGEPETTVEPAQPAELPAPPPPPSPPSEEGEAEEEGDEEKELGARMTFLEHLDELRRRILYSIIGMAGGFAVCWIFREQIFAFIQYPILQVLPKLVVTRPTEAFTIYMKVAFVGGIFVAAPVILIQVWMFIAPGLYRRERRFVLPFLLSSTTLFLLGGAFAYYIVLPPALRFLILDFGAQFTPMITAEDYFDLVFIIIVGMGAVFQLPVLIAFLSMFGLITPRFLWKNFRYAFLLITIAAAVVSPTTDPFNLLLWTGPMVILYMVGIIVSWVFKRRRARKEAAEAAG